jgi:hypothetical protein
MHDGLTYAPSYFDDLESFFYVLCYLVVCYPASGSLKPNNIPSFVSEWFRKIGWHTKFKMMLDYTFPLSVDNSFQPPVFELLTSLHKIFRSYTLKALSLSRGWTPEPEEVYDGFLGCLANAIDGLKTYEYAANPGLGRISPDSPVAMPLPHDVVTIDEAALHHKNSDGTDGPHWRSTFTTGHHSEYQASTDHVVEGRLDKRMRTPSPRPSKRIKVDHR